LQQRQRQAEMIRQWQPWKNSTGAKTAEGKAKASRNAFKGGVMQKFKELRKLLHEQKKQIENK
ncbi:MAG TPA: hypothetical protein DCO68_03120, partial [Methylophilaceae bacterium]|nr:hypothetical protein [Methylophilaceae bacterium]